MIRVNAMQAISEIGRLQQTLNELGRLPRKLASEAAPKLNSLIRQEFRDGTDPYGRPWAPLARATIERGRRPPPLSDTWTLRRGTRVARLRANAAGLVIEVGATYGYFHQVGFRANSGRHVPARRIVPQYGIPATWRSALSGAAASLAMRARARLR